MNPVDIIFSILLVLALLRGYAKGLLGTAGGYVAPVLAFLIASNWSDPVRDRLAAAMPATPDFFLDILAPFVIFVVVVGVVRLVTTLMARALGVGMSLPSRIVASAVTAVITATVLGSAVLAVHQMRPAHDPAVKGAGDLIASPLENAVIAVDQRFAESRLAPVLADMASSVVEEAIARKDEFPLPSRSQIEAAARKAAEAASTVGRMPTAPPPADPRGSGGGK